MRSALTASGVVLLAAARPMWIRVAGGPYATPCPVASSACAYAALPEPVPVEPDLRIGTMAGAAPTIFGDVHGIEADSVG